MNAKKAKLLRKQVELRPDEPFVVRTHSRLMFNGMPMMHTVVNPIRYPEGCRRRVYRDAKRLSAGA